MNKNLVIISSVVIASLVGISIFFSSAVDLQNPGEKPIELIMNVWPGYAHVAIAEEREFFEEEGISVNLKIVKEYPDMISSFLDGGYDGFFGVYSDVILLNAKGIPVQVVYVTDYSNGADVILSETNIVSVTDLKGKIISIEEFNSFSHLFLLDLLRRNGLTETDVTIIEIPAHKVLDALDSGIINAGHSWEPTQSEALAKGFQVLATSADTPGIITDVLAFKKSVIDERPDDVKKILRAIDRALKYRNIDYIGSYGIMSDATGIAPSDLKSSVGGFISQDLEENKKSFTESEKSTSLYSSGKIISDFFLEKGIISAPINLDDLLATEIIMEL